MLQFGLEPKHRHIKKIPSTYPDLIEYESRFTIIIDDKIFFDEPYFPVLEFIKYAIEWKNHSESPFEYSSIETEDNPLIIFSYKNDKLDIYSPWQKFHCQKSFNKQEIIDAIEILHTEILSN